MTAGVETYNCLLSVVIISHDQRELLRRCIDSVLRQKTTFKVQVIVSDDRSNDGTREMLTNEYDSKVFSTFFDSDSCGTALTLERASFNRLNGLKFATGKYLIHIDGDDFFTGEDLFQEMVDTLEAHPECTMCCQNFYWAKADELDARHAPANSCELLKRDGIIPGVELCRDLGFLPNSCFCMRRSRSWASEDLHGIPYDDCTITARYLGEGKIAVLNRCDFVYVQYEHSSFTSISDEVRRILFQPGILRIRLLPNLAGVSLRANIGIITYISGEAIHGVRLPEAVVSYFSKMDIFLYRHLCNSMPLTNKIRYFLINKLSMFIVGCRIKGSFFYRLLYRLAIGKFTPDVII